MAEGYIPAWSTGPSPELQSHETCCMLNAGDRFTAGGRWWS
ncbi:sensory rhodopsin transducer [Stenotrophomonas maltophilia]|nr:sensory rhodopsin transducer [Stenotrophomonas maltophilia]